MFLISEIDWCENIVCNNGGTCVDGVCNCPSDFTGEFCDTGKDKGVVIFPCSMSVKIYSHFKGIYEKEIR